MPILLERKAHLKTAIPFLRRSHPLARGLVGAWPVGPWVGEEGLRDISGFGAHGTVTGSGLELARVVTEYGSAVHKPGNDNRRFNLPNSSVLPDSVVITDFTMHATVERLSGGDIYATLFGFGGAGDDILLALKNTTSINLWMTDNGNFYTGNGILNAGEQNHITFAWRNGTWEFWANGVQTGGDSGRTNPTLSAVDRFFLSDSGTEYGGMKVSDWRVWDRCLSPSEIIDLHMDPWGLYTHPLWFPNTELTPTEILSVALDQAVAAAKQPPEYRNPLNPPRPF